MSEIRFDAKWLFERLLARTRDELLELWREQLSRGLPADMRIPRALEAWAAYWRQPSTSSGPGSSARGAGDGDADRARGSRAPRRCARHCRELRQPRRVAGAPGRARLRTGGGRALGRAR